MPKTELTGAEIYDLCFALAMSGWATMSNHRRSEALRLATSKDVKVDEIAHCMPLLALPKSVRHMIPNGVAAARELMRLGKLTVLAKMHAGEITSATSRADLDRMRNEQRPDDDPLKPRHRSR